MAPGNRSEGTNFPDAYESARELARVGTTASVICRLEDADYDGHSLAMLRRIAGALGLRVEVRFVPEDGGEVTVGTPTGANPEESPGPRRSRGRRRRDDGLCAAAPGPAQSRR